MLVHIACGYRSKSEEWTSPWSDGDWRGRNLVKAVKRQKFGGMSKWVSRETKAVFVVDSTDTGHAYAVQIAATFMLKRLREAGVAGGALVPVPASGHVKLGASFTGQILASKMAELNASFVARPVLHFDEPQPKSQNGGSRNPHEIQRHLRSGDLGDLENVILLDDVMTTGGHLRAASRYLRARGVQPICGVVLGRTLWAKPGKMFDIPAEDLDD